MDMTMTMHDFWIIAVFASPLIAPVVVKGVEYLFARWDARR